VRVDVGTLKKIEGDDSLKKKAIPKVQGKVLVSAAEAGNEMVFESGKGALGGIASVEMGQGELEVNVLASHELFESGAGFIVKFLENGMQACLFTCSCMLRACAALHGLSMDGFAVLDADDEQVGVA
jgi:hypothetical protein